MKGAKIITLNGKWNYIKDSECELSIKEVQKLFKNESVHGFMDLPTNWELAGLHNFNGTVWFNKILFLESEKNFNRYYIEFNGVDYFCEVFVNGKLAGKNTGYFNKFEFNLTDKLKFNNNNIFTIKVTSPKEEPGKVWPNKKELIKGIFCHHDCRPGGWSLEHGQDRNTGGVWNDINLIYTKGIKPEIEVVSDYDLDKNIGIINVDLIYSESLNESPKLDFNLFFENKKIKNIEINFISGETNNFGYVIKVQDPKLWATWDIGEPNLYKLVIASDTFGEYSYYIGFRNVKETPDYKLLLNGKPLFIRGTNIIPEQMLSALSKDKITKIVNLLLEANINAVRVHAHVNRNELYDALDRAGIIVWQDFALQWTYKNSKDFIDQAVLQIEKMVNQFKHHASIVYWCCHNEPGYESLNLDNALFNAVKINDVTRIIKLYSNYEEHPYYGWYWGNKDEYFAAPMGPLVTEFGAQGIPDYSTLQKFMTKDEIETPHWDKWTYHNYQYEQTNLIAKIPFGKNVKEYINNSQAYQSDLLYTAIKYYRINKYNPITGIFQFMFIDCWESITWSVVDYFGNKKKGFYTLQKMYKPFLMIVNERQKNYMQDSYLNLDVDIINDTYDEYENLTLSVVSGGKELLNINKINVKSDSVKHIEWEKLKIPIKNNFTIGENNIEIVLFKGKEKLQAETIIINVINKKHYWLNK